MGGERNRTRAGAGALLVLIVLAGAATLVFGQSGGNPITMREKVYEKLSRAQEAAEAGNYAKAYEELGEVRKMKNLDSNEKAQLYTAYGYLYFSQERYRESIEAYETVLAQENLPEPTRATTLYTLAQLRFHVEDYTRAAANLETWLSFATNPAPEPLALLGQAYYQLGKHREAVKPLNRAISIAEARGQAPRETWYGLLRALYFELEDYPNLLRTLEILVSRFPRKDYWIHLAAAYGEMGDSKRQLSVYDLAYEKGYLTGGSEQIVLAQLLLQAEVPYRAGRILEKGLNDGNIPGTAENWRLLSQAWILARENVKAVAALKRAASLSDDGELDARLAQSYANLDDWDAAIDSARTALRKGVRNGHELQILIGMAHFEQGKFEEAKSAFRQAMGSEQGRKTAGQWVRFIEKEQERLRELQAVVP